MIEIVRIDTLEEGNILIEKAADFFSSKWHISKEKYLESMKASRINKRTVPKWYVALSKEDIIGGIGFIDNDFHEEKLLTPNICAFFVEEVYRKRGIGSRLLERAIRDIKEMGYDNVYLITDWEGLYEKYGFKFIKDIKQEFSHDWIHLYGRTTSNEEYKGMIIKESLKDDSVLDFLTIEKVEVIKSNKTPKYWTMIDFSSTSIVLPYLLSKSLNDNRGWYIDFTMGKEKYIILKNKILKYEIGDNKAKEEVINECIKRGIKKEELDFSE